MFEIQTITEATLSSVMPRTEVHGEDRVFAISLGLKLQGPNTLLDLLSPTLRHALYDTVPGQDQLPGVEPTTPLLRSKFIDEVKIGQTALEGWTLLVEHGIDEPISLGGSKVDKFRCVPHDGGSIDLMFRISSNDVDANEAGILCSKLSQEIGFTLIAPKPSEEPIDGSQEAFERDHPDAGDMFSREHYGPDDADDHGDAADSEGGETDVDDGPGKWPFPRDPGAIEQPPQSATAEGSKRTARGRPATKSALDAGMAKASGGTES